MSSSAKKSVNPAARFIFQFILFLVMVALLVYTSSTSGLAFEVRSKLILGEKMVLFLALFFMIIGVRKQLLGISKRGFWYLFRHPKVAGVAAIVIVIIILAIKIVINNYQYNRALDSIDSLQERLTPIFLTRVVGSDIQSGRGYPSGWSRERIYKELGNSAEAVNTQPIASLLNYYQSAVKTWGLDILAASSGDKKWSEVPDQPSSFTLVLFDKQAVGFLGNSIRQIRNLQEFGDGAIVRGDRKTMRVIAAKLLLQKHFLENLSASQTPSLVLVSTAYAAKENRNPCIKEVCLNNMLKIVPGVYRTALGYAAGEPRAAQEWRDNWQQASREFEQAGYPLRGTGITQGASDKPKYSPLVQGFFDLCSAAGGTIGGTGGVKTRLPTSEDGYTCWETRANGKCWEFQTFSGGFYAGGDAGVNCPEKNLLPPPPPPVKPKSDSKSGSSGSRVCPASAPVDCGSGCCPYGEGGRTDVCCPGNKCVTGGKCPSSGGGGGSGSGACPEQSKISGCGTIKPSCNCPANCPNYFIITNAPPGQTWIKGYKQCTP